jgi:hypothetical protein
MLENTRTEAHFMIHEGLGLVGFQDDEGNQWSYGEMPTTVSYGDLNYTLYKGDSLEKDGITVTFTRTKEELLRRAEEYFIPYAIRKDETKVELNFREKDRCIYLN